MVNIGGKPGNALLRATFPTGRQVKITIQGIAILGRRL
jgi:hypothetical protein